MKLNQAFRGYAMLYNVEIIERKDPIVQLKATNLSIKDLFGDLSNETKGFKYPITVKVSLKKIQVPVYFNSLTKTVINQRFRSERVIFKKFYTRLMFELIKGLAGMLNQLSLNTLKFRLIDHYQEVLMWT